MKSFSEWEKENIKENWIGNMFAKKQTEPAQAEIPKYNYRERKASCPFCRGSEGFQSVVLVHDTDWYPNPKNHWHCKNCHREWEEKDSYSPGPGEKGMGGTFLPPEKVLYNGKPVDPKHYPELKENHLYNLYLAGVLNEDTYLESLEQPQKQATADINQIASRLQFLPTTKKKLIYQYVDSDENMPAMTYTVAKQKKLLQTPLDKSQKQVKVNDIIMSGPSRENYSVDASKFPKLYVGQIGGPIHPEQTPRNVAYYDGKQTIQFSPSWGGTMTLEPGDYLVKEAEGKYYRIAKKEYETTYNVPGKVE